MKQSILQTTAGAPLGYPHGRKLLRVESGQYAGRQVVIMQTAPGEIVYSYADRPYASWSAPVTVTTTAADGFFDCILEPDGDITIVYTDQATGYLMSRRLGISGGTWVVMSEVTVTDAAAARHPSLAVLQDGTLWVCWCKESGGIHTLYVKSSTDGGMTWGSGPSDQGDPLTLGASSAFGRLVIGRDDLFAVYTDGGLSISMRSKPLNGATWSSATDLATGFDFDEHFDAAVSSDGRIGVVWDNEQVRYREFDGEQWQPAVTIDTNEGAFPQLVFLDNVPMIVWTAAVGSDEHQLRYSIRQSGSFAAPVPLDSRADLFGSVVLYHNGSASFADVTAEAGSAAAGDVVHPVTGKLVENQGDTCYLGMDEKFRYVKVLLSTAGAGGTMVFSYWNGSAWVAFTPVAGAQALESIDNDLLLWEDYDSIPFDWQKKLLSGSNRFWVRLEVLSSFATAPVGSKLITISDLQAVILRR